MVADALTIVVAASILWLWGHLRYCSGKRKGFAAGCRFERELGKKTYGQGIKPFYRG